MRPRTKIRVPKYLAPIARQLRDVENIIHKGAVIDSPTVKSGISNGAGATPARGKSRRGRRRAAGTYSWDVYSFLCVKRDPSASAAPARN
jgi:hypothetical protein